MDGGAAFVGALAAGLGAVAAGSAEFGVVGEAAAAPGAVAGGGPGGAESGLVGGHGGIMPAGWVGVVLRHACVGWWSSWGHVGRAHCGGA